MTRGRKRLALLGLATVLVSFYAGAETILLPDTVPSFNQNYTDGPGAWGNCNLGTAGCPDQICTTGCLVTAFASVLAYYRLDVSVSSKFSCTGVDRSGMDPGVLNDWLRENGGFGHCAQDPIGDCCLAWDRLPGDIELIFHANRSDSGLNPVSSVVIDHALRTGQPVVAGVHWGASCRAGSSQTEDCHWVVLTGKAGDTYTIIDPINPDRSNPRGVRTTLDAGTHGAYIIDRFVVVPAPSGGFETSTGEDESVSAQTPEEATSSAAATALVLLVVVAAIAAAIIILSVTGE